MSDRDAQTEIVPGYDVAGAAPEGLVEVIKGFLADQVDLADVAKGRGFARVTYYDFYAAFCSRSRSCGSSRCKFPGPSGTIPVGLTDPAR